MQKLKEELERKNKHFDFQFTNKEYDYIMENARLKPLEKQVLNLRRQDKTIVAIGLELGLSDSGVNKIIRRIKNKIVLCILFG